MTKWVWASAIFFLCTCSRQPELAKVSFKIERGKRNAVPLFAVGFDCYGILVTGKGISNLSKTDAAFLAEDHCSYPGIGSTFVAAEEPDEVVLEAFVPRGDDRLVQVVGLDLGEEDECPLSAVAKYFYDVKRGAAAVSGYGGLYELGRDKISLLTDTEVEIFSDYDIGGAKDLRDCRTDLSTEAPRLVRLRPNGSRETSFNIGTGFDAVVNVVKPLQDGSGKIYVGGDFTTLGGTAHGRIVRLGANGSVDSGFNTGTGFNGAVLSIVLDDQSSDIYVGGDFTDYNGTAAVRIARLNSDGSFDTGFSNTGMNAKVYDMIMDPTGTGYVYAVGNFTNFNAETVGRIVRINPAGTRDTSFSYATGFNAVANALLAAPDGGSDIYVGGAFTNFDGTSSPRIARLNSDGSYDTGFNVGTGFSQPVYSMAHDPAHSTRIYMAGDFATYNGTNAKRLVLLSDSGALLHAPDSTGFDGAAFPMVFATDGSEDLWVGGMFTGFEGLTSRYLTRLNSNFTLQEGFAPGSRFNDIVNTIAAVPGSSDVYVGGTFTSYIPRD